MGNETALAAISEPRLPYHPGIEERFGVDKTSWRALVESTFPTATSPDSVVLALSYCKARNLDPFKRVVHIVPIWDDKRKCMVDTVWPGIAEYRTTAFRTGVYAGKDKTEVGPAVTGEIGGVKVRYPEWMSVTVYRLVNGDRIAFPGPVVYWLETFGAKKNGAPNKMWAGRPFGMLEKCAEAAALRCAFPEELGGEPIADEVGGYSWHGRAALPQQAEPVTATLTPKLPPPGGQASDEPRECDESAAKTPPEEQTWDPDLQAGLWQDYVGQLDEATGLRTVDGLERHAVGNEHLSPQNRKAVCECCEKRRLAIRGSRGDRSGKDD